MKQVEFVIGSRMYDLVTPSSDTDLMRVGFDYLDQLTPKELRKYPEKLEQDNNNIKEYSLEFFLTLTAKGNPNTTEMCELALGRTSEDPEERVVLEGMQGMYLLVKETGASSNFVRACLGHVQGVKKDMYVRGVTPKRYSHALRVAYTLEETLNTKKVPVFRESPKRKSVLEAKMRDEVSPASLSYLDDLVEYYTDRVNKEVHAFPDSRNLQRWCAQYFQSLFKPNHRL